jgi:hypothetical protein
MVNKIKLRRHSSHAEETAGETSDFSAKMDNKSTHSRTRRRPTRSRAPTEDASLTEDQATAEAGQGGVNVDSQSASRATSVSELTEPDMELRPAKRTRSKRDMPKEDVEMSRASSPLSADDGSMNGQIIDFHQ